jgi:hypothetical protein
MWSKTRYLKRNMSCDAHMLNELLETDVPWDDVIVLSAGKLRKLWNSLKGTAQFSVWKTTGKDSSEVCATACQNCAVDSAFTSGMTSHSKIAQFNWERIGCLRECNKENVWKKQEWIQNFSQTTRRDLWWPTDRQYRYVSRLGNEYLIHLLNLGPHGRLLWYRTEISASINWRAQHTIQYYCSLYSSIIFPHNHLYFQYI